ncbi:hypothetical protein SAMN05920897_10291 [Alkalispirochaeta americana]|uniref:Uncharacterized protein n=1 Tax=Alkalispirochaeta americana TaxID=159291 RepID=A0A1N6P264_9SPIO|nr:hypothetical protein [Alkalispirochaeta americana]SIP98430.1 hypothetical protein SAMN05920897_10291 [Alkalispirochaeta americana]
MKKIAAPFGHLQLLRTSFFRSRPLRLPGSPGLLSRGVFLVALLVVLTVSLASCLSVETELDLRRGDDLGLVLRYRINPAMWDLGVFDPDSPERAIPVSRRDVEETAGLYPDVRVAHYSIDRTSEAVIVEVQYRAGSVESLKGLWGTAGGAPLVFFSSSDAPSGSGVRIPLATGPEESDPEQQALLEGLFAGQRARVTVYAPEKISRSTAPEFSGSSFETTTEGSVFSLVVAMHSLVTHPGTGWVELEW